ncbi:enoyl-ACP reductase FabI [Granulosicoccus antarcticus]|uniref:Enoyl-[acyl-carrier-protein] reductase [NADH] n=1 Tax=Granulosicoccus antarcticus IMCC3135 TaxID=1192854 RepID=A0A2Z2NUC5_9GAMM|nr:enoyl-ACP reductase [Granulosicoccus antarcticus]ASJ75172.1 Enoyl-[acyl-carrier-protein] reductase [NADH] FabI [Granulosicoccus antarcticus IMCC3135]
MGMLDGKRFIIFGIASKRSIAWGIAEAMHREGATLAFTYQNDRLKDRVIDMAAACGSTLVLPCDVAEDSQIDELMTSIKAEWTDGFDGLVHAVAFAPREALDGDFLDSVTRESFRIAHDVSSYSFAAIAKAARPQLRKGGSLITLSYLGAVRAMPNYNVMGLAKASLEANTRFMANAMGPDGIRVNAISAGPIKTLAAAGISDFKKLLNHVSSLSPMRENTTIEQVGDTAAFLASSMAAGITGQIIYVDGGFNIVSMPDLS